MRMRELEQRTGVGRETIRFYIREGLLPEPDRASRNSASYSDDHVTRLRAIKRLQEERFLPLAVIRTLLDGDDGERWLAPQAFPQLDSVLTARFDHDAPRVAVADRAGADRPRRRRPCRTARHRRDQRRCERARSAHATRRSCACSAT